MQQKMKKTKASVCLLFLSLSSVAWGTTFAFIKDATEIDEMRHNLYKHTETVNDAVFQIGLNGLDVEKYLIKSFRDFGDELDRNFPDPGYSRLNSLNSIWLWNRTREELDMIETLYYIFRQMQHEIIDKNKELDLQALANISDAILHDPKHSIISKLARITEFIVHDKLFVQAYQEAASQICSENQSLQQLLYNLYGTVTLAEIKGYSMIQFSYMLLRLYNQGANFTEEMELTKQQYAVRTSETVRAVKTAMAFAPRDLWMCDPARPKLNETYTQLTELFQGYIVNEIDLNAHTSCRENCAYYSYTNVHGCYKNQFCAQQRKCNGNVIHCEYIDSDMWVCPAAKNSHRRYEYVVYENNQVFGQRGMCKREETKVDSWWYWLFWHCSYCFCYCDDQSSRSDRYFSLREVTSDTANNKVVTGVALKKVNQIMHIQIQEGQLLPRGNINKTTVAWKPVVPFSILDKNVKNGVDYHSLAWEKRGLDLDDLVSDQNHLITGLRFRTIGSRLNLEIQVTPFTFTSGELSQPSVNSFWIGNDVTNRSQLELKNPDIPTRTQLPSLPDSKKHRYVNFSPSDRVMDAAQNTVPFIDIQPVKSDPPVPMAGAGVFHKGRPGSGGYVALKLITYDFTPHLMVDLPPAPPVINHSPLVEIRAT
ncbi:chemokine-like protein orion isoform X2 [Lasioglossum baleicum]|uniref:chemokine-like protein orion isoform X2 n=1 Tax=Lasioglossum baleicum TaxID=434251 RepID=UPI003FCD327C